MIDRTPPRESGNGAVPKDSFPGDSSLLERLEEGLRSGDAPLGCEADRGVSTAAAEALNLLHRIFGAFPPAAGTLPRMLGRFEIYGELGRGRFGIVCRARDLQLNRDVALKIARDDIVANEPLRERFQREAKLAAGLDHPGLVRILDVGEENGLPYFVMPLCSGQTLEAWFVERRRNVAPKTAARIVAGIAEAVGHAHAAGIVHRDLKPANVMVQPAPPSGDGDREWAVQVFDFGLGACVDRGESETASGMVLGTLAYLSPEQAEGRNSSIGPAADVFALGVILYELLTGRRPFAGDGLASTIRFSTI